MAQRLKHLPGMRETWVRSLGQEDPLEKDSIRVQRRGLIAQSFCVIKSYESIKEIEKASDIDIRRG